MVELKGLTAIPVSGIKDLQVTSGIQVQGQSVQVMAEQLELEDNSIILNFGNGSGSAGISIKAGSTERAAIRWNDTLSRWESVVSGAASQLLRISDLRNMLPDYSGMMIPHGGANPPTGWLRCDGSEVSQAVYPRLYNKIAGKYNLGNETTGYFRLPKIVKLVPLGIAYSGAVYTTLAASGGTFNHSHTFPSHTHDMSSHQHAYDLHSHYCPSHTHYVAGHCHGGGNTYLGGSSQHRHRIVAMSRLSDEGVNFGVQQTGFFANEVVLRWDETDRGQVGDGYHGHGFTGYVGTPNGGQDGDNSSSYLLYEAGITSSSGTLSGTGAPINNNTGASSSDSTTSGNPPCIALYYIIKT